MKKLLLCFSVGTAAILTLFGCNLIEDVETADPIVMSADEIASLFEENETDAKNQCSNKIYEITGTYSDESNSVYIYVDSTIPYSDRKNYEIRFELDTNSQAIPEDIAKGDSITIKGRFDSVFSEEVKFDDALFIEYKAAEIQTITFESDDEHTFYKTGDTWKSYITLNTVHYDVKDLEIVVADDTVATAKFGSKNDHQLNIEVTSLADGVTDLYVQTKDGKIVTEPLSISVEAPQTIPETDDTVNQLVISILELGLADSFPDTSNVEYDKESDCYMVSVWQDGLVASAMLLDDKTEWNNMVDVLRESAVSLLDTTQELDPDAHLTLSVLNDMNTDNTVLIIYDGVVMYDAFADED